MPESKYPSNSYSQAVQQQQQESPKEEPPKEQPTLSGKVKLRKKSLGQRFADTFLVEDISTTIDHVWSNVVVPKIKDILSMAVDTALFGAPRSRPVSGNGGTNYNALSKPQTVTQAMVTQPNVADIMLSNEQDVFTLYNILQEQIRMSGFVTVGYLYRFLGLQSDHTKENYGWYSLSGRSYTKSFDQNGNPVYIPNLPKPVWLKMNQ